MNTVCMLLLYYFSYICIPRLIELIHHEGAEHIGHVVQRDRGVAQTGIFDVQRKSWYVSYTGQQNGAFVDLLQKQ